MKIESIKNEMKKKNIFFSEDNICGNPTVVGYEKKFKWSWFATQLNTFIVASDFGDQTLTAKSIEDHLMESFKYADRNYKGWPRGLQSGVGVISILLSTKIDKAAKDYCRELKSGKKWAAFSIPVVIDSINGDIYSFKENPTWGRIYYPHFKDLINGLC